MNDKGLGRLGGAACSPGDVPVGGAYSLRMETEARKQGRVDARVGCDLSLPDTRGVRVTSN